MIHPCKDYDNAHFYACREIHSNDYGTWKRMNQEEIFNQEGRAQAEREQRHIIEIVRINKERSRREKEFSRQRDMDEQNRLLEEEVNQRQCDRGEGRNDESWF